MARSAGPEQAHESNTAVGSVYARPNCLHSLRRSGRDHNPSGFTSWMAGAGVKATTSYGPTDDFSYKAVENVTTVYDFCATVMHILGLDHERLSFYYTGMECRLTDVHGHVIKEILSWISRTALSLSQGALFRW